jgi:hypothetical protein
LRTARPNKLRKYAVADRLVCGGIFIRQQGIEPEISELGRSLERTAVITVFKLRDDDYAGNLVASKEEGAANCGF